MSLEVNVLNATNVPNVETFGKSDPYARLEFRGQEKKTEVKKGELCPKFDETFEFDLRGQQLGSSDVLQIQIKDWEMVGRNRVLAQTTVSLKDVSKPGKNKQQLTLKLKDSSDREIECTLGIGITYKPPPGSDGALTGGATDASGAQVVDQQAFDEGDAEEEYEDIDPTPLPDGTIPPPKKRKKRSGNARKSRGPLSTKQQDYQVRIKIVEARQVPGANISPIARVTCYNQTKQTRAQNSTNSPFWNEVFYFNYFLSPAELFDEVITFGVYNSRKLRSDAFIGSFKCDIGMVYDEPNHSLLNKWLLLSDPEDTMAGAKGYLKISATVLGAGDDAPSFKVASQDEDEDIEANLLRPAGVQLRPATFTLRVYRAEDLPRMDSDFVQGVKNFFGSSEKKELCDPYFTFSFAGKKVQSKILYNSENPEWNQELRLGLRFPSMCERIKLQMFDWDRLTEQDVISETRLDLRTMSRPSDDDGFLPTFGPCFVNFYGSPREFSELPDEHESLNFGKGEGVAYRGRALVELSTTLGEMPEIPVQDILSDDILRVQKFMRRRKFRLHAAFLNATMVSAVDAPVEFEVSIGNYGNKLDESVPPCSSTTQPTNAVFDGSFYYFLPWGDTKPCCVVDSHWEDISFRLEALNMLLHISERLEDNVNRVKVAQQANLATPELAQLIIQLLNALIADTSKPLPKAQKGVHVQNNLDTELAFYREAELEYINEQATKLRENATDIDEAISEIENYQAMIKNMATEPQNSMPDVVIWMISGEKRIAYFRCAAHLVLWSANPDYRGKYCGQLTTIQLKYPGDKSDSDKKWEVPAMLRLKVWLGLEKHELEWHSMQTEGELAVFAETYENQVSILGNWTNKGPALSRPKWSDVTGKVELRQESFEPPPGWRWDSEWYISPELSMLYDKDAGHTTFLEDIYECQSRYPAGHWGPASVPYTDVKGDTQPSKDEVELPEGWQWEDVWDSDLNRAVDEEGFEYAVEATMGGFGPVCKNYHLCRRRRWVRPRKLVKSKNMQIEEKKMLMDASEGWEYAPMFRLKFHHKERKMDMVRKRRWHRKMVCETANSPCFFNIQNSKQDEEKYAAALTAPRMFLTCNKPQKYQLRAYVYQARDLKASDSSGLSDPFIRVSFLNQSQSTETCEKTVCPTWDQTLIFDSVDIHGSPEDVAFKPPQIVVEIFDYDTFGSSEFMGRAKATPIVKLDPSTDPRTAVLQWCTIYRGDQYAGELLAAFELLLCPSVHTHMEGDVLVSQSNGKDLPFLPSKRGELFSVPSGIRPVLQRTAVEIMCWGVRNMRKFQLASVTSPSIEFEVGGHVVNSKVIKNTNKNPNFDDPVLFLDIWLPKEELYTPPLNIRVRDNRQFGRKPLVGIHTVKSLESYRCDPVYDSQKLNVELPSIIGTVDGQPRATGDIVIDIPDEKSPITSSHNFDYGSINGDAAFTRSCPIHHLAAEAVDEDIDWWSKYYASVGELDKCKQYLEHGYDTLQVLPTELERVAVYNDFSDFCHTFELLRGKATEEEECSTVGEYKGTFKVYPLPEDQTVALPERVMSNLPSSQPEECIVRVYIIRACDLQPNDSSGLADPYVQVKLGKKKLDTREHYVPNSLNPVFGKMFEVKATLPIDKDLVVSIRDYDLIGSDDVIGETRVDLENRLLTKYGALVGIPKTYCVSGPSTWRDGRKPKELLEDFCAKNYAPAPIFADSTIKIGNKVYNLSDFEIQKPSHTHLGGSDQRLALHVLNTLPKALKCPLVPEHLEMRPLYNPLQPGIEQGKIQMWVDMFPKSLGEPGAPVDIMPRKPKMYELRIVIYNTEDVVLDEESITGEQMSDIYVKGWLAGMDEKQETDVHYRSLDGEGNFNWRFVFPFEYIPAEEVIVIKRKEHFWNMDETELKLPPLLMIQIWDNDKFSADDFLGTLELRMNRMTKPAKKASSCKLTQLADNGDIKGIDMISLFEQRRIRGFWPCYSDEGGDKVLTGKVEMEIELVTEGEARERPAGPARDEPNENPHLEPPNRPETSFLWLMSPWKTMKHIIWKNYKWYFITGIIIILLIIFLALFIYNVPGVAVEKLFSV